MEYSKKNPHPLSHYKNGSKYKAWWNCNQCNNEWQTRIGHRFNGSGCPKCGTKKAVSLRLSKKQSILITHSILAKEWADETDIQTVSAGSNKKYKWRCDKCNKIFESTPNRRCNQKSGCPYCSGRLPSENNNMLKLRPELAKELVDTNPAKICCNSRKKYKWRCKNCEHLWISTANDRSQGSGCPKCAKKNSKPQQQIEKFLKNNNILFEKEYKIHECRNKRSLPFDFAIFSTDKLIGLIEYQGEQHYFPIWGQKSFNSTKTNDKIKKEFCNSKKIPFLSIAYSEFNEHEKKISNFVFAITTDSIFRIIKTT